jgi:hypothetical protein
MMTRIKTVLLLLFVALTMTAQNKLFTLEDLNFGGTNYHAMQPKNIWLTWWGDQLIQTDVEECYTIDVKTGKKKRLFTLDDINRWAESDDSVRYVRHLMNATFPYADKPLVMVATERPSSWWISRIRGLSGRTASPSRRPTTGTAFPRLRPTLRTINSMSATVKVTSTN